MRNFCTYCGFRNAPEATACLGCGAPLEAPSLAAQPVQEAPPTPSGTPRTLSAGPANHPMPVPGGWYSTQQHTPIHPAEPSAGAVSAWLDSQQAAIPPWPLPPAGGMQPPNYPPPYPGTPPGQPYGQIQGAPYQGPYGGVPPVYSPAPGPYAPPYGQPGQFPYPGQPSGPYGAPSGQFSPSGAPLVHGAPVPPYGQPYPPGSYPYPAPAQPGQSQGGYAPTPGYSTFSARQDPRNASQPYPDPIPYAAPYPVPAYRPPYRPVPYSQAPGSLADAGQRFGAHLLDSVVLAIPMFFFLSLVGATQSATLAGMWLLALFLCPATYFISAWATTGRTIGYRAMGLRLARSDGGQPSLGAAIARFVTLAACLMFFFPGILGAMWMLWDEKRQGWHDKVADTVVVRT